ncbi:MAG: NAD-dependent epimerase/dehydratase family protein [Chloroflexota bacterium]|nr:NAD-dependent epimerase/dehydratase family protein [Chloroflexota bacterium]
MEILITGGNGFLGRNLIPALQERGDHVRVLALPTEDTTWVEKRGVAVFRGDVRNPDVLTAPMRGVDTVFHLAAMMGLWRPMREYNAVNVVGTGNVCRAALAAGIRRLIHISSWTVYGPDRGRVLTEDDALQPQPEPYSITKAQGDLLVQRMIAEEGLPATIIRPGTIFGAGDRLNFGRIADRACAGKDIIIGSGRNALPLVYVTDVVQGLLLCAGHERAQGQAYNISNDEPLTQEEFLHAIAQELGVVSPWVHIPYRAAYALASVSEVVADLARSQQPFVTRHGIALFGSDNRHSIRKARTELGYVPQVSIREGVERASLWYEQHALPAVPIAV